uniref:Transcription initiation factor IIF subunit alpha n=1 Tax=Otolemur garnettii TaxID=30611 RepID=H0XIL0_OTOGA
MATPGPVDQTVTECVVRVPKNMNKKYSIMAFNAADKVNFATWSQARLERDLSNRKIYQEAEMTQSGSGAKFSRKLRDEAPVKKEGVGLQGFRAEDQPWLLHVSGESGRKFKGIKRGGVTENASYYIFTQCPDGSFEAFPVHEWYNFTPLAPHRTPIAEEAAEAGRSNKVQNHFSILQQRRPKDQHQDWGEEDKKARELHVLDLEGDQQRSSEDCMASGERGSRAPQAKKKVPPTKAGGKRKKKGSDDEAFQDGDNRNFEGHQVDYKVDGSSSSQDEPEGKPKVAQEEERPKAVDELSENSKQEKGAKKAPAPQEKPGKDSSKESDIDSEASSALSKAKREQKPSGGGSRASSRPGTPSNASTLGAASNWLEQGKRAVKTPAAKRLRLDAGPQSLPGRSPTQPPSGKSTPSSGDVQVTEDAVCCDLTQKPMTTKDLLMFQTKKMGLSSEQTVNVQDQNLKWFNPELKMVFSLKK